MKGGEEKGSDQHAYIIASFGLNVYCGPRIQPGEEQAMKRPITCREPQGRTSGFVLTPSISPSHRLYEPEARGLPRLIFHIGRRVQRRCIPFFHPTVVASTNIWPQPYLPQISALHPHRSNFGLKGGTTTWCVGFTLDTQRHFPYIFALKKQVLININWGG